MKYRTIACEDQTILGKTALDFDPSVATASPNNANGTVDSPNNTPMISLVFGKPAPTVAAG
jgi:hypothetical protein